ncbi:GMC oxidoreductase protein [Rutstroemia sp. NJR-2017a BVV2]|nr:GMC oxidoreductase protein [Rutstroemia sp. NJR-2017a BVV2]
MRRHFEAVENNHYLPPGTPGHGFHGYLDVSLNSNEGLKNQTETQIALRATAQQLGEDPDKLFDITQRDINNANPNRDTEPGMYGMPTHRTPSGRRVSARNPVVNVLNATKSNGQKKYKLTLRTESFVTKILFDTKKGKNSVPQATGVEFLAGRSVYSADPRYNASVTPPTLRAFARKEVIVSAGVFNSPQLLKLSGIGPKAELSALNITVVVDLPGVGANLQDNTEFGVAATFPVNFTNISPVCTYGAPGDPCLAAWQVGKGPYAQGAGLDALLLRSSDAVYGENDLFLWGAAGAYRGYWPSNTVNVIPSDPPNTFGFSIVKINTQSHLGTVLLKSADPRDTPDINFRFFEGDPENKDLKAMAEAVDFGRQVFANLSGTVLSPFNEVLPCQNGEACDVEDVIRKQTWSHHATSSCSIGADGDPMAVLDSRFRVRGTKGLRVVDGSAFPRTPGSFPTLPTFTLSQKAAEVILQDGGY